MPHGMPKAMSDEEEYMRRMWSGIMIVGVGVGVTAVGGLPPARLQAASPLATVAKGKVAFQTCAACHSDQPGVRRVGPSLAGVFGTPAGQVSGFPYSVGLASSKLRWDRKTLDAFIAKPQAVVPGTNMTYAGVGDPAKRQAIIDYLESLH
jgi:cytochrome c